MPDSPFLSQEDVRAELAQFHRSAHRTPNTAFYGRGDPNHADVVFKQQSRRFDIVPVTCELELRQKLQEAEAEGKAIALLVDYDQRLPVDVQGRLAGGSLRFISPERRLVNLFGVPRAAPALVESPLAEALLRSGWVFPPIKTAPIIDLGTAWRHFLGRAIGLPTEAALTEEALLDFFALRSPSAADPLLHKLIEEVPQLAVALEQFWGGTVGPIARLCWINWRAGRALDVAAMTFVLDGLIARQGEGAVKVFLSLRLTSLGDAKSIATASLLERWARLAPALYLRLGDRFPTVLQKANAMVDAPGLDEFLGGSRFLSIGFDRTKQELAAQLTNAVSSVNPQGAGLVRRAEVAKAEALYRKLSEHHLAKAPENAPTLARTMMGLRLLAFLSIRTDWETELANATPVEPVYRLAEWFAHEGGFVDMARKLVRGGHDSDALEAALARVADAADACRDLMDRRFGRALALWNEDRRAGRILPIENALAELGVRFLEGGDQRRLLILVMDGMSWASAAEILLDISEMGYSPLRWQPPRAERPGLPVPMIAALPTMTDVSRAALFAGKLPSPGEPTSTTRDPERLLQNKAFVKAFGDGPTLLLRTDAESQTGELTENARKLVQSGERVVGVVVNAVDDQLTSKPGYHVSANRTTIKALQPLLELATDARRAVLLIADHGHVTSTRPHTVVDTGNGESPRFREIGLEAPVVRQDAWRRRMS